MPEVSAMKGVPQPKEFHKYDVWGHTMFALDLAARDINDKEKTKELMWALLLHDVGKPVTITMPVDKDDRIRFNEHDNKGAEITEKILTRLKLPNRTIKHVCYIVKNHMRIGKADEMRKGRLKLLMAKDTFSDELNMLYADIRASHEKMDIYEFLKKEYKEFVEKNKLPPAIVDGNFLIGMGFKPSPLFNKIIKKAYEAQLEGSFSDKESAKKFVKSISNKKD
jgi:putative nucleotidyltransferase with HDIG domain